jgi:hypothetical protein
MDTAEESFSRFFRKKPAKRPQDGGVASSDVIVVDDTQLKPNKKCKLERNVSVTDKCTAKVSHDERTNFEETKDVKTANAITSLDNTTSSASCRRELDKQQDDGSDNPFARFAFQEPSSVNQFAQFAFLGTSPSIQRPVIQFASRRLDGARQQNERDSPPPKGKPNASKSSKESSKTKGWVRMKDLPPDEVERIRKKWHGLVATPDASLEDKRFQVLVAARLHARCQETVVRRCMQSLVETMNGDLTVSSMAIADPEVLAQAIASLQFFNVKAQHLVKAAQEIEAMFGGIVPETESSLQAITGIGPVMADLLAVINTRASFDE